MTVYYAQNFEDVYLYRCFKHQPAGFYIDVGAWHPTIDSVTKLFYDLGWRGINIEPTEQYFALLEKNRERDINLKIAIGKESRDDCRFFQVANTGISGASDSVVGLAQQFGFQAAQEIIVPMRTMRQVCAEHAVKAVDFMKIDVEGGEFDVLVEFPFETIRPRLILVEATLPNSTEHRADAPQIRDFLGQHGYEFVFFDGLNDYFIAREAAELAAHFKLPPNFFDNIQRYREAPKKQRKFRLFRGR